MTTEDLLYILSSFINELIQKDFDQLIFLLYKIDINEEKLKSILKENQGENAAKIIAQLIIERLLQKIESKKDFSKNNEINDEEKW